MQNNQNNTKLFKKSEIKEILFLTYNECAENQSLDRLNEIFSSKLNQIFSSKLDKDQFINLSMKTISMKFQVIKLQLCQALQGQFGGKVISREEFDTLNSKPTTVEKAKNLVNNIFDITVNPLFNSSLDKISDMQYVEYNTTARNKNTFTKRLKELKEIANNRDGVGM